MKQRDQVAMTPGEIAAFLAGSRKLQLATINADGSPHLVTMYYVMLGDQITFWTYRTSQKALNLARDPRVTCLVESGGEYFDLKGVQVRGEVEVIEDPERVREVGRAVASSMAVPGGEPLTGDALDQYVEHAARKRFGYTVRPLKVLSWDHAKLIPAG